MSSSPFYMIGFILLAVVALFVPDVVGYATNYVRANNAAEAIVDSGQKYAVIEQSDVERILSEHNLSPRDWLISFNGNEVEFNEPMAVQVSGAYQIKALYAIGKAFGDSVNSKIPIQIQREAVGQVYRRG